MTLATALYQIGKFVSKIPPDVRQLVIEVVQGIAAGDPHEAVVEKARRAALAMATKKAYRRGPHI